MADLEDIHSWYGEQGAPDVGTRIVADIIACIERLEDYPDIGRIVPEFGQDYLRERASILRFVSFIGAIRFR